MVCNKFITIWHYDEDTSKYSVNQYMCGIHGKVKYVSGNNGVTSANTFIIRIPTEADIILSAGDYAKEGIHANEKPPKESCMAIVAIADNRVGAKPHWRIDAV